MLVVFMLCLAAIACTSPTDAPAGALGILRVDDDSVRVAIPAAASAGVAFTVEVTTIGLDSCYERSETVVRRSARSVVIEPWDVQSGSACFPVLHDIRHDVSLSFEHPGTVDVTIRGRSLGEETDVIQREFQVVVQ